MDAQTLGAFILNCRKDLGLTQGELAQKLNVTDKAISRWGRGVGFPDIKLLEPLADALQISVSELIECRRSVTYLASEVLPQTPIKEKLRWLPKHRVALINGCILLYILDCVLYRLTFYITHFSLSPLRLIVFTALMLGTLLSIYREEHHDSC